jgi:Ca2+-binding RTX toxin-like protein
VAIWNASGVAASEVHGQLLNADGSKLGDEFVVNSAMASDAQRSPTVAALPDGKFVVAWDHISAQGAELYAQIFNSDGSPSANVFPVDLDIGSGVHTGASMTALGNGRFAVTWSDGNAVAFRVFHSNGTPATPQMTAASNGLPASIAELTNGQLVVTWQENLDVHARIFNANGSAASSALVANTTTLGNHESPSVTALADGRFVVVWENVTDPGSFGSSESLGQIFNTDGTKAGAEFLVNTVTAGDQAMPHVMALPDGRFVATWSSTAGAGRIVGQLFEADGTKSGGEFSADALVGRSDVAVLADGRFAIVGNVLGESFDVGAQIFDPREQGVELAGTDMGDQLHGTDFNDLLKGAGGADELSGHGGDDVLVGGAGGDTLLGGAGSDTASYANSSSAVTVNLATYDHSGGDAQGDVLHAIENVVGSNFADTLTGNDFDNILEGGAGADTMIGGGGVDTASYRTSASGVNASLLTGLGFGGDAQGDNLSNTIEKLIGSNYADTLTGHSGANVIEGGLGHDIIDGRGGDDTAVFSHNFNDYTVRDFGTKIEISGPDGTDLLTSIEHLQFADVTVTPVDDGNPLFDTLYYLGRNPDVFHAGVNALDHFNAVGWHEGRNPNAFFDTSAYLAVNKDVAAAGMNPLDHYHQVGWHEGRDPGANFDTTLYLIHNPDVAAAGIDPLAHYLASGFSEGRQAYQAIAQNTAGGFDAQYYLFHNPDVAAAGIDPLFHFSAVGWKEGRDPNAWFDADGYLAYYGDVAAAGVNPLEHYMQTGWKEGRDPSSWFDTGGYLAANPDVDAALMNPLDHFLQFGIYEGRQAVNDGMWG